jgi:hypothetical protein
MTFTADRDSVAERDAQLEAQARRAATQTDDAERRRRELAAREASLVQRELRVAQVEATARDAELLRAELRGLEAELAAARRSLPVEAVLPPEEEHLLFLPTGGSYRLVRLDGPPPSPGDEIAHESFHYRVIRIGPSPLPGDRRRCAYADRIDPVPG